MMKNDGHQKGANSVIAGDRKRLGKWPWLENRVGSTDSHLRHSDGFLVT